MLSLERWENIIEGLHAEFGELITGLRFETFFTPNMLSKNDASRDIGIYSVRTIADAMSGHRFLTPRLASKPV